jgi:hypothetical protein
MKDRLTVTKLLEYASFVLNSIEEGWQGGFRLPWTLIEYAINCYWRRYLSLGIKSTRCLWLAKALF